MEFNSHNPTLEMHFRSIERKISEALDQLVSKDIDILSIDVNERAISHRLAVYLETLFPDWNVDCEYNRNHSDPKMLDIPRRKIATDDIDARTVFPDIIIHRRNNDNNLLVIEMKKSTSRESDHYDYTKLEAFKCQLGYRYAAFIKVGTNNEDRTAPYTLDWI